MRPIEALEDHIEHSPSRFVQLTRHFFGRFFDAELISAGSEAHMTVGKALALLACPGVFFTFLLLPKYGFLVHLPAAMREPATLMDKYVFICFSTVVLGFVTVLEWDALFPDHLDYAILTSLPLRVSAIFTSKFLALLLFLALFIVDVNAVSSVFYPAISVTAGKSLVDLARQSTAHWAAVGGAGAFVFLFLVGVQGVLMNILSYRTMRRVSLYIQVGVLVLLISLLFAIPTVMGRLTTSVAARDPALYWLPPAWFLGLYERLTLGSGHPVHDWLAGIAVFSLGGSALLAAGAYFLSYRRYVRRSLELVELSPRGPGILERALNIAADRFIVRHPLERAAFYFVAKTLARSRKHRLFAGAYVGLGIAVVLQTLLHFRTAVLLSIPLVLSFFLLSGLRAVFAIPAELRANWAFRIAETDDGRHCLAGVRKAVWVFALAPLFALTLALFWYLWGPLLAILHVCFAVTLSAGLLECLLINFRKIPFTCSYLPGKVNLPVMSMFYWAGFTTYAYTMARFELWMLERPAALAAFYIFAAGLLMAAGYVRARTGRFRFIFEDEPEPAIRTLGISA